MTEAFWDDVRKVAQRLDPCYEPLEKIQRLNEPHPQLGGESATALILDGKTDQVHAVIDRLDTDGFV